MDRGLPKRRRMALDDNSNMNICDSINKGVVLNPEPRKTFSRWTKPPKCLERGLITTKFMASTPIRERSPVLFEMNWLSPVGSVLPELRNIQENNLKNKSPVIYQKVPEYLPLIGEKRKEKDVRENNDKSKSHAMQPNEGNSLVREPIQISKNAITGKLGSTNSRTKHGGMVQIHCPIKAVNIDKLSPQESLITHTVSAPVQSLRDRQRTIITEKLDSLTNNENYVQRVAAGITDRASNNEQIAAKAPMKLSKLERSDSKDQTNVRQETINTEQSSSNNVGQGCVQKLQTGVTNDKESKKVLSAEARIVLSRKNIQQTIPLKSSLNDSRSNTKTVSSSVGSKKLMIMDSSSDEDDIYLDNMKHVEKPTRKKSKNTERAMRDIQNIPVIGKTDKRELKSAQNLNTSTNRIKSFDPRITRSATPKSNTSPENKKSAINVLKNAIAKVPQASKETDVIKVSRIPKLIPEIQKQQKTIEALSNVTSTENKCSFVKKNRLNRTVKVVHSPKRPVVSIRSKQSHGKLGESPKKMLASFGKNTKNPSQLAGSRIPTRRTFSFATPSRKPRVSFTDPLIKKTDIRQQTKEVQQLLNQNMTFCIVNDEVGEAELKKSSQYSKQTTNASQKTAAETPNVLDSSRVELTNGESQMDRVIIKSIDDEILAKRADFLKKGNLNCLSNVAGPTSSVATEQSEAESVDDDTQTQNTREKNSKPDSTTVKDCVPYEKSNLTARNDESEMVKIGTQLKSNENVCSHSPKKQNKHSKKASENSANVSSDKLRLQAENGENLMGVAPAGAVKRGSLQKKRAKPIKRVARGVPSNVSSGELLDEDEIPPKQKRIHKDLNDNTLGLRRSTRHRSKPLNYWNGERLNISDSTILHVRPDTIYRKKKGKSRKKYDKECHSLTTGLKAVNSIVSLKEQVNASQDTTRNNMGYIVTVEETEHRVDTRNNEDVVMSLPPFDTENDLVFEPDGNCSTVGIKTMIRIPVNGKNIQMECMTDYTAMRTSAKRISGAHGEVLFGRGLDTAMGAISSGNIEMSPHSAKGFQIPKHHHLIFCVMTGSIIVTIHHAKKRISIGSHFFIPCGISYNLENDGEKQAVLSYFRITKGSIILDEFN